LQDSQRRWQDPFQEKAKLSRISSVLLTVY
jgi:hypothetical protein